MSPKIFWFLVDGFDDVGEGDEKFLGLMLRFEDVGGLAISVADDLRLTAFLFEVNVSLNFEFLKLFFDSLSAI